MTIPNFSVTIFDIFLYEGGVFSVEKLFKNKDSRGNAFR